MNRISIILIGAVLLGGSAFAETAEVATVDNTRAYLEVLRSDFNSDKVALYNRVLQLTEPEAKKFWPIYRNYERELMTLSDQRMELMRDFMARQDDGKLTDETSTEIADRWLKSVQARLDLWKKYYKKISSAVSPTRAAQFLQLENQIALFIDIAIASEMPAIAPAAPK
jgi:hypothetical protein